MNRNRHLPLHNDIKDYGSDPLVFNMNCLAKRNTNYRAALWTGTHLQVTLMSIPVGEDIGIEMHDNLDQFIRIESGCALVQIGSHLRYPLHSLPHWQGFRSFSQRPLHSDR